MEKKKQKNFFQNTIEGSKFTKNLISEYNIDCDLTGDRNFEVAPHPSYFESIKDEAETYKKEFGIETQVYSKEEFNEIGHGGNEQFGAMSYQPGFAINPLKFLLGMANEAKKSGVKIFQKVKLLKLKKIMENIKSFQMVTLLKLIKLLWQLMVFIKMIFFLN